MKIILLLVLLESIRLGHGHKLAKEEKRRLIAYDTEIFHKIPEYTIYEEKLSGRKTTIILETKAEEKLEEKEKSSHPSYEFGYGVKDPISGDHKDQWEKRHGDRVKGGYRFHESDGTQRVVEYKADGKRGFEATVKNLELKEEKKEEQEETEEEAVVTEEKSGGFKKGKVAHSYSYLKRTGH
ncbi:uncharacterized protein LOC131294381 [Anopheles ziemanni]|uniref:uncharacterized protein LOC131265048 n=1 Tax=Anopheles coustani TaxID=139045 RepID=UPI002658FD8C|nr:uncharacterized protein LOC131265048 [Anopheles coustani]XP_058178413.1 uncharacterized protein LOC131294381 [Anopheles ziemanni]